LVLEIKIFKVERVVKVFQVKQKIKCINKSTHYALTVGKIYQILDLTEHTVKVINDYNVEMDYARVLFASRKSSKHIKTVVDDKKVTTYVPPVIVPPTPFVLQEGHSLLCLDATGCEHITEGNIYTVHAISKKAGLVDIITDDEKTVWSLRIDRFAVLKKKPTTTYYTWPKSTTTTPTTTVVTTPTNTTQIPSSVATLPVKACQFTIGQELICIRDKDIEHQCTVGRTYKVVDTINFSTGYTYLKVEGNNGLVTIVDPSRFMAKPTGYDLTKKED
jgi:hypothetical protein